MQETNLWWSSVYRHISIELASCYIQRTEDRPSPTAQFHLHRDEPQTAVIPFLSLVQTYSKVAADSLKLWPWAFSSGILPRTKSKTMPFLAGAVAEKFVFIKCWAILLFREDPSSGNDYQGKTFTTLFRIFKRKQTEPDREKMSKILLELYKFTLWLNHSETNTLWNICHCVFIDQVVIVLTEEMLILLFHLYCTRPILFFGKS